MTQTVGKMAVPAAEKAPVSALPGQEPTFLASVTPTQVRRPWRSTARTLFQTIVALAVLFPIVVDQTGLSVDDWPWLAIPLAVATFITRLMAIPQVETFLRRFLPFLAAAPKG